MLMIIMFWPCKDFKSNLVHCILCVGEKDSLRHNSARSGKNYIRKRIRRNTKHSSRWEEIIEFALLTRMSYF
jgi:hypothetical protein